MLIDWTLRLRSLFRRDAVERELDDELRSHFEHLVESHVRRGLARDEAVRRSRIELGGFDQIREEHRDTRGIGFVSDLGRDLRLAIQQFRRAPGFAGLAVLCLGLGIGVNTSLFGVINSVLLRPMSVAEPERLVWVRRADSAPWSYPAYRDVQARTRQLSGLALALPMESDIDVDGESSFIVAEVVTANYAEIVGLRPTVGRWLVDDREAAAVISHAVWERHFNLDPDVVGRLIRSESESYTIVGVAPRDYTGALAPVRTDLWVPIQSRSRLAARLEEGGLRDMLKLFGRLRDGATAAQASAELDAIDAQLMAERGRSADVRSPIVAEHVRALPDFRLRQRAEVLSTLLAAVVGLVLLIACVNVGNLLLVRGAVRQREFAVRRALGASRFRLLQQLLIESLVLAVSGAICGVVLAVWANRALATSVPPFLGIFAVDLDPSLDWRAIVFASVVALATTVFCGLRPAWRSSGASGLTFKNEIGGGPPRRRPLGLVAQVVISLVLLFVAGSVLQALQRLHAADPGFDMTGRLYAYTLLPSPPFTPERRRDLYAQAVEQLRALPGVRTVGLSSFLPLMPAGGGCASRPGGGQVPTTTSGIDAGYFDAMGIDVIAGRAFTSDEISSGAAAVVVSESLGRRLWPGRSVVGERLMVGCDAVEAAVVIGVARDSVIRSLGEEAPSHLYRPLTKEQSSRLTAILLNVSSDPAGMVQPVRRTLLALGEGIRVYNVQPLRTHVEQRYALFQWFSRVLTTFGLLALILAAIGLYGVIAYRVTLRTQEIGVRMALGASRRDVFREVLGYGLAIVLVGVAIGEVLTIPLTRLAGSLQEGIAMTGAGTHVRVALVWIAVALCACVIPAARAARVDPMVALRHD